MKSPLVLGIESSLSHCRGRSRPLRRGVRLGRRSSDSRYRWWYACVGQRLDAHSGRVVPSPVSTAHWRPRWFDAVRQPCGRSDWRATVTSVGVPAG